MVQRTATLTWVAYELQDNPAAFQDCDFSIDTTWKLSTVGSLNDSGLEARVVTVNNLANSASVALFAGPFNYSIGPFSKKSYFVPLNTREITIIGSLGVANITFWITQLNPQDDGDNALAIQIAAAAAAAGINTVSISPIINNNFDSNPSGGNTLAAAAIPLYMFESWEFNRAGGVLGATLNSIPGLNGATRYCKYQRDAANAALAALQLVNPMLSENSQQFQAATVCLSFDVMAGANFSAAGGILTFQLLSGTGTNENPLIAPLTGQTIVAQLNAVLTPGGPVQRLSMVGTCGVAITQLAIVVLYTPVGVAGADDSFTVGRFQIDPGSSPFTFRPTPADIESLRGTRQYNAMPGSGAGIKSCTGYAIDATHAEFVWHYPRQRNGAPTVTLAAAANFQVSDGTTVTNATVVAASLPQRQTVLITVTVAAGLTAFRPMTLITTVGNAVQVSSRL